MRAALLALMFVPALLGQAPQTPQAPPAPLPMFESATTELVVLPVTVTDRHDQLISGLPRDHFTVYDNGRRQDIALFTGEDTPVTVGLVIDDSRSMGPKMGEVIIAVLAFARTSNPADELYAIEFNDDVHDVVPGRPLSAADVNGLRVALQTTRPDGRTALYDAVMEALARVDTGTRARKVLIVVSDGGDNASQATLDEVLARARAANVMIYTIGLFDENDADQNPGVLKQLARTTGGERFLPDSAGPLLTDCEHIAREIRSVYTIGYVPPDRDGHYHRVRVDVQPPDRRKVKVRTRPGYFAAAPPAGDGGLRR